MNTTRENFILLTDSYKDTHWLQHPPNTSHFFSFLESRGGQFPTTTFYGLQYILMKYFSGPVVINDDIEEAEDFYGDHFGTKKYFNRAGWERIVNVYGGHLPLSIRAIPEGTTVPTRNALMTVVNTDDQLRWLTNHSETLLSQVWYPTTVCTLTREMKKIGLRYLRETGDPSLIDYKLHDFGYRGSTSNESAGIGGSAHLVNFRGTDTQAAVRLLRQFYGEKMAGTSIPAAEHSTITSWGREHEVDAYDNMLTAFPSGLVAVVSDSYDIMAACRGLWGNRLKDKVLSRDGTLVVRPDSGYPPEIVVKVLDILEETFGYTVNAKGYKVLNPKVRVIQGDGIDYEMIGAILKAMKLAGWSADNVAFGSGGGILQKVNRDTQKFAFKCCSVCVNGIWRDVYKDPVTDPGKRSKAGLLKLVADAECGFRTCREEDNDLPNELVEVFRNGEMLKKYNLSDIRQRAAVGL